MARTSLIVVLIGSLITPCTCFTWTAGPPPNGSLQECLGNNVSLDWDFMISTEDTVLSVQWFFTNGDSHNDPQYAATASSRTFVLLSNNKTRVEFVPKAGLRLYNVSTQDLGTYTVSISLFHRWNVIYKQRSVTLALPDTPVLSSGRLRAWVVSGTVTLRGSSHVRLACGTINNHQHANFSVTWTTPSGRSLPSMSQADGVFYLTLDNPVAGGPYSCHLQGITALSCLRNGSQTTRAVVDVDALGARMLVLEDSARRHDRGLELQERVADVVSQSINNITVNLQVVDELTEETSERVDSLSTHVHVIDNVTTQTVQRMDSLSTHVQVIDNVTTQTAQRMDSLSTHVQVIDNVTTQTAHRMDNLSTHAQVIDNVTTQTAQRMDKVTRKVEDQREAQSRMKESLKGVMEELTNQSGHVTNLALSVDDLKSDTAKLSGSVDSLTSELRATVDVQRKQIEAMTSQDEKQHADMVLLLQKTNNLTALAERQQEELIQQKQTISELSTIIDTQSGNMAQQSETITYLMSNLTSVVGILGTMASSPFYKDLEKKAGFYAYLATPTVTVNQPVVFKLGSHVGGGYDASSGVYTAPYSGWYTLQAQLFLQRDSGTEVWFDIMHNTASKARAGCYQKADYTFPCITSISMYVAKGDRLWVKSHRSVRYWTPTYDSFFSGVLVTPV